MATQAIIYRNVVMDQLEKSQALQGLAFYNGNRTFESLKKQFLLREFDNHEVTKEMIAGPDKESSDVIPGGYGNLYAFLGFNKGTDVTGPVRKILDGQTKMSNRLISRTQKRGTNLIVYEFAATVPTMEYFAQVESLRPPDWGGKSWVEYIEEGVPNFAYFIFNRKGYESSRSGPGLEAKNKIRETTNIQPISYITKILEGFFDYIGARFTPRR